MQILDEIEVHWSTAHMKWLLRVMVETEGNYLAVSQVYLEKPTEEQIETFRLEIPEKITEHKKSKELKNGY